MAEPKCGRPRLSREMRHPFHNRPLLIAALAVALAGLVRSQVRDVPAQGSAGTATLEGRVTIMRDRQPEPVRRARVMLQSAGATVQIADTDTTGAFQFHAVPAGTYKLAVDKPGFVPVGHISPLELRDEETTQATVTMQRGAAIEGRLVTQDGDPAVGLVVSAVRLGYGPYGKKVVSIRQTKTDDLGRFRLHTLVAGEYFVEAKPDTLALLNAPVILGNPPKLARTYYAGTARLSEAGVVVVAAEQQVGNISFTLAAAVTARVSGNITLANGQLPFTYTVRLQGAGAAPGDVRCWLNSSDPTDHSFDCPNVPPGDYWLLAAARATPAAELEFSATPLVVQGQDIRSLTIRTAPGVAVHGRVEVEGRGPIPAGLQVVALDAEYEYPNADRAPGPAVTPAAVGADGTFVFGSLAGARVFRLARAPENMAIQSVSLDSVDISDQPTSPVASEKPATIRIVVTSGTGSITGSVTNGAGQAAAGALAVAYSTDNRRWGARSRFVRTAEVSTGGRYTIRGLLPGDYRVAFVDDLEEGAWEDPEVLARLESVATRVTLGAAATQTVSGRIR